MASRIRCFLALFSAALVVSSIAESAENDVSISEINYNADPGNPGGEFLEIANHGLTPVNIGNWVVDQAVSFVFPSGTTLGAGEHIVLANNAETAAAFYGVPIFGEYLGRLANGGDTIVLKNATLTIVDLVKYDDDAPWPTEADGGGPSLELIDPELDNNDFNNWGLGQPYSPGVPNTPSSGGVVGEVAISEIMYKPRREEDRVKFDRVNLGSYTEQGDDLRGEYVEVINVSNSTINLAGWAFTDGIDYTFGNVSFAPGETLLLAANPQEMEARTGLSVEGPFSGTLDNGGERLTLLDDENSLVDTVRYNDKPPWPVSPDQFGFSLEVVDPSRDNSTAANWRTSTASYSGEDGSSGKQVFVEEDDTWRYLKGISEFPSGWTTVNFDAGSWLTGRTGIGYGDGDDDTVLSDMRNGYIAFAARKTFRVSQTQYDDIDQFALEIDYDDAFVAHLNGVEVVRSDNLNSASTPVPYDRAAGEPGHEAGNFESFSINKSVLNIGSGAAGDNVLAIQLHNREIDSSDASMAARLVSRRSSGEPVPGDLVGGGTPGFTNSVNADGLPPFVASLEHSPVQPVSLQSVVVTAFIESESPLTTVQILYTTDTSTSSSGVEMFDDGNHGDGAAGDGFWGGRIPAHSSPTFVNYRVRATDSSGLTTVYPYDGEPSETQAYLSFDNDISTTLPIYHLYIRSRDESTLARDPYDDRYVNAHLAIDGVAYPNIDVRLRGRQSRKSSKRQWKFRFNRHQLHEGNRTLDTMLNMPFTQWFAFELFDRGGIANLPHDLIRVHKNGSFFGVYVMFESPNSAWVRKEGLPASTEVYKARSVETPNQSKNSDLFTNQLVTDLDFWGAWNKKLRPLEKPTHIRELTFNLNNMSDNELLPWLDQNVNLDEWFERWIIHLLTWTQDFAGHNYYAIRPGNGGKWTWVGYDYCSFGGPTRRAFYGDGLGGDNQRWERNKLCQRVSRNRTLRRIWNLKLREILDTYWDLSEIVAFANSHYDRVVHDRALDNSRWGVWRSRSGVTSGLSTSRNTLRSWVNGQSLPALSRTPVITPAGGPQTGPVTVTISSSWTRYYTTDGSDPRLSSTRQRYSEPFLLEEPSTVLSAAITGSLSGGNWTDLSEVTYEVPTNVAPVAEDQDFATDDTLAITLSVEDPDGPGPYVYTINGPSGGSLSGTAPNLTYTPDADTAYDTFTWSVNDGVFDSEVAVVTIDIIGVNAVPVGSSQSLVTAEGQSVGFTLSSVDPDGPGPFSYSVSDPANGEVTGTGPSFTYTPAPGFSGEEVITWTVGDGVDVSDPLTVTIAVNARPLAQSESLVTDENAPMGVTLSYVDADGPGPYVFSVSQPGNGSVTGTPPTVTYVPANGFFGEDTFTWTVDDGMSASLPATVTITVNDINIIPVAQSKSVSTRENAPVGVTLTVLDSDGPGPFDYSVLTDPADGGLSGTAPDLTYTPSPGFSGEDSFTYSVSDGLIDSNVATVTISVTNNERAVAQSKNLTTDESVAISIMLSFTDPDGGPGPYSYTVNDPENGTLSGVAPSLTYTPSSGFTGQDSFTWSVNDGTDESLAGTINISVAENAPPLAHSKNIATSEDSPVNVTLSFSDPDGPGPHQYSVGSAGNGVVSGTPPGVTYRPNSDFLGVDTFTYTVHDGLDESLPVTVTITVTETNDLPVPQSKSVTTEQGEPVNIVLSFVDPDGPGPYLFTRTNPANGTLSGIPPSLTYTPHGGFFGQDRFTYRVNDGINVSASSATVTINVERSAGPICYCDDEVGVAFSASPVSAGSASYSEAIGVGNFDSTCRNEDCSGSGALEVQGQPGRRVEGHVYVNIISQIPTNESQIAGWALSIKFDDNGTSGALTGATTEGTAGCDVDDCPGAGRVDGGFQQTQIVRASRNGGQEGAVSAVVMTFNQEIVTLPAGQSTVLGLTFEVEVPQSAGDSPLATFSLVDGLRGSGLPVKNVATVGNSEVPYGNGRTVRADVVAVSGSSDEFMRADYNSNGTIEALSDSVFLLRWLFRDGDSPPCLAACDFNGDGRLQINDPVSLLIWGFRGGNDPVPPFPGCGPSSRATDEVLGCLTPSALCR